jgi:hypothetical protein
MKRLPSVLVLIVGFIAGALLVEPVGAQLQQSGGPGSTVTVGAALPAGTNLIGKTGIDQTTPGTTNGVSLAQVGSATVATGNGVTGTGVQRVTIASDQTAFSVNSVESGTWTVQPGNTANTTAWFVKSIPATTCGTTAVSQAIVAVPTSSTAVFASTTCLIAVFFENSNAGAQTVTLTDNAGTPLNAVGPAFSVPGLSNMTVPLYGIPFTSGVKWTAGGTGVLGGMAGVQ